MDQAIFKQREINKLELWQYLDFKPFQIFYDYYKKYLEPNEILNIINLDEFFNECFVYAYLQVDNQITKQEYLNNYRSYLISTCEDDQCLKLWIKFTLVDQMRVMVGDHQTFDDEYLSHYFRLSDILKARSIKNIKVSVEKKLLIKKINELEGNLSMLNYLETLELNTCIEWIETNIDQTNFQTLPSTTLKWIGSQTDLAEILKALIFNGNIKGTQKELFSVMSIVLNFPIDETDSIKSLRRRNADRQTKILDDLKRSYLQGVTKKDDPLINPRGERK